MNLNPKKRYSTIPLIEGLKLSMESIAFCQVKKYGGEARVGVRLWKENFKYTFKNTLYPYSRVPNKLLFVRVTRKLSVGRNTC